MIHARAPSSFRADGKIRGDYGSAWRNSTAEDATSFASALQKLRARGYAECSLARMRSIAVSAALLLVSVPASAGPIAIENAREGNKGWDISRFGNAQADGVVDLYPAQWSIRRGETVRLRVRSTSTWSLRVYRLGWYGGAGAREVLSFADRAADPQPYPRPDPGTGLNAAGWHDSLSFPTDGSWAPGLYVARADHSSGKQAMTFFAVRDDDLSTRMPILIAITTATHQAYNAWPGASRGGKSLYGFNSSGGQAVKVSLDRPYLVGGGTADVLRYEYPFLRWAEKNAWDVAWCTEEDLARDPSLLNGRRVFVISGHWEYLSKGTYDAVQTARDAGTNLLIMSGDTIAWQVRLEDGGKTMVGYKESWTDDPEHRAGVAAAEAGKSEEARAHFRIVTRGWKNLGHFPRYGIDERRPASGFLGVQSAGAMGPNGPWGDFVVRAADHWLFAGTGMKNGDLIEGVMGYEYDSLYEGDPEWAKFIPPGRIKLASNIHRRTRDEVGGAAYHRVASGAETVALGAVNFAYALDGYASPWSSEDERAQKMIDNALRRWTAGAPPPSTATDAGLEPSDIEPTIAGDAGVALIEDASAPASPNDVVPPEPNPEPTGSSCNLGRTGSAASVVVLAMLALAAHLRRASARSARE